MIPAAEPLRWRSFRPASFAVLLGVAGLLGFLSGFPYGAGVFVAGAAVIASAVLRSRLEGPDQLWAPVPALVGLMVEAVAAPVTFGTEVVAGFSGLAFLTWLADDPSRPLGGAWRGLSAVSVAALALGIAWASALFLPSGALPLGVAGAFLTLAILAVAYLVGRPQAFDREPA